MIWQADFRDTLQRVADMGGCDLIVTSPPYCDARTASAYGTVRDWTEADYRDLGDLVKAALRPGGHAIVNVDAPVREWRKGYGTERGFHAWRLMLDWAERVGLRVPDRLAFGRMGIIGEYKGRFRNDWEPLLWFQRTGAPGYFNKSARTGRQAVGGRGHGVRRPRRPAAPDGARPARPRRVRHRARGGRVGAP